MRFLQQAVDHDPGSDLPRLVRLACQYGASYDVKAHELRDLLDVTVRDAYGLPAPKEDDDP
jgi:hypothetical protein